jgi:hypothetical protein
MPEDRTAEEDSSVEELVEEAAEEDKPDADKDDSETPNGTTAELYLEGLMLLTQQGILAPPNGIDLDQSVVLT